MDSAAIDEPRKQVDGAPGMLVTTGRMRSVSVDPDRRLRERIDGRLGQ
jgi:hypothetical protein